MAEQPKKPQSAYWLFLAENRAEIVKCLGTAKGADVAKAGGERWKALSAKDREPFEKQAQQLKDEYDRKLAAFKSSGGVVVRKRKADKAGADQDEVPGGKRRKLKKFKDANAPKKPAAGAYGRFLAEKREEIRASLPSGANPITDVAKKAGELFKALPDSERKRYEAKFQEDSAKYKVAMEKYKANAPATAEDASPAVARGRAVPALTKAAAKRAAKAAATEEKASAKAAAQEAKAADKAAAGKCAADKKTGRRSAPLAAPAWASTSPNKTVAAATAPSGQTAGSRSVPDAPSAQTASNPGASAVPSAQTAGSRGRGRASGRGSGRGRGVVAAQPDVDIPDDVLRDAKDAQPQLEEVLRRLLSRDDVIEKGITARVGLDALKEANGLLHPARRALLGT